MDDGSTGNISLEIQPNFISKVRIALKRIGFLRSLSLFIMIIDEERKFIRSAVSKEQACLRRSILQRIKYIYKKVVCLHFPLHYVFVSKFILDFEVPGPIIECGTFKGGSTAQLSVIAKETGRKLYVCDSFQGLPSPVSSQDSQVTVFNDARTHTFHAGDYAATLEEVRSNVATYGDVNVCEFVPGFFDKTLPGLNIEPAVIVLDVDLVSSARDCLKSLWPRLKKGGYVFTHEAESETYIKGLMDRAWWQETLGECPPLIFGAGSSLSPVAEGLAVFRKE